jgi:hypothetical protein
LTHPFARIGSDQPGEKPKARSRVIKESRQFSAKNTITKYCCAP